MSEQDNDLKPNFFQTPNIYVDVLMPLLTPEEFMVLMFAVRRTLGFHKRQDRISMSQFCTGTIKNGDAKDDGTGLSPNAVRNALRKLELYRILTKVDDNNPPLNEGGMYEIQFSSKTIDWAGLEKRYEDWATANSKRAVKGAETRRRMNPLLYDEQGGSSDEPPYLGVEKNVSEVDLGGSSDEGGGVHPMNIQKKEEIKLIGIDQSSMHGDEPEPEPTQPQQVPDMHGMDVLSKNPSYRLLKEYGIRSDKVLAELAIVPVETIQAEWALVKNSSIPAHYKPNQLAKNLRSWLVDQAENPEPEPIAASDPKPEHPSIARSDWQDLGRYDRSQALSQYMDDVKAWNKRNEGR